MLSKYLYLSKTTLLRSFSYRASFYFYILGNIIYLLMTYYLWQAIYENSSSTINGMTFHQVFLYLAVATVFRIIFQTGIEWGMSEDVTSGDIYVSLTKPYDWQGHMFFLALGSYLFRIVTLAVPSLVLIFLLVPPNISLGLNLLFILPSLLLAFSVSFMFDYLTGLMAFYTQSIWGIIVVKEFAVGFFSGAVIPQAFFPGAFRELINYLPFKTVADIPVRILIDQTMQLPDLLASLGLQLIWLILLFIVSRLFFSRAIQVITINGG